MRYKAHQMRNTPVPLKEICGRREACRGPKVFWHLGQKDPTIGIILNAPNNTL